MSDHKAVRDFITDLMVRNGKSFPFDDGDSLFLSGRLDSLSAIALVGFLEQNYRVDMSQIFSSTKIDSVDAILKLVTL